MMTITVHVYCDVCQALMDTPHEDVEISDGEQLGDEHETSGLVYVTNYEGSGWAWMCGDCHAEHLEDMSEMENESL
jgi:hypothetical protein